MEQMIITSRSPEGLNKKMKEMIEEGWTPVGSHQVTTEEEYAQYAGTQYRRTIRTHEYSQTMKK